MSPLAHLLRGFVRAYQLVLSPLLGRQCRFLRRDENFGLQRRGGQKGSEQAQRDDAR